MRIYFTGSPSCGKSTLAKWTSDRYALPLIEEVARQVLADENRTLDEIRSDVIAASNFQSTVFRLQLVREKHQNYFVSDRSFDFLVYTAFHGSNAEAMYDHPDFQRYLISLKSDDAIMFFVRPHLELLKSDGQRSERDLAWEEVCRVDGAIACCLELFSIPYISVAELSMKRRVRLLECVMRIAGLKEVETQEEESPF